MLAEARELVDHDDLIIGEERFSIVVDWDLGFSGMEAQMPLQWVGDLPYHTFVIHGQGKIQFLCCYVIVGREGTGFFSVLKFFGQHRQLIRLAKPEHLFAFGAQHPGECTAEKNTPILAGGKVWLCSHNCLYQIPELVWDYFYHAPGRKLSTASDIGFMDEPAFLPGTRFLAVSSGQSI